MKGPKSLLALLLPLGFASCSLLTGLLHMQAVEVSAYAPSEPYVDPLALQCVSLCFSSPMHQGRTEEAFRLDEDGVALAGRFTWAEDGRTVRFTPCAPLRAGTRYSMAVSTAAEDLYGNSLRSAFLVRFSTGSDAERLRVTGHEPEDGATVAQPREPVRIDFSEPPDPGSVLTGLSLLPAVRASIGWSDGGRRLSFTPLEDYAAGREYLVRLAASVCDASGNTLAEPLEFRFRAPAEPEPQVLAVQCARSGRPLTPDAAGAPPDLSLGIEKDDRFQVTLSLPLPLSDREPAIGLEPPLAPLAAWDPAGDGCLIGFSEPLQYGRLYTLRVLDQSYSFVVNGEDSVPPEVLSVRYCADVETTPAQWTLLDFAGNYSFLAAPAPAFDFHLRHALRGRIDLGSFLKALSIEAGGGCLRLECRQLLVAPFAVDPDPLPTEGQSVVRLLCSIEDDPAVCGPLSFRLDTRLGDDLGNRLPADHVLVVNNSAD